MESMPALRIVFLLLALALCYLFFAQSQKAPPRREAALPGQPVSNEAHSEYKRSMDQAQAVARQMQARHAEADEPTR